RSIILILLLLDRTDSKLDGDHDRSICHSYQIAPLTEWLQYVIKVPQNESCSDNNCMLLWGITHDKRVRILAQ
ncbi:hypothetical protein PENTCL1PPCAC_13958, partial [Pristionchus entomophagus]